MKALFLTASGGPEALRVADAPAPNPSAGEIMVRVHAAAVTRAELKWKATSRTREGFPRPYPFIPGHEFSGEVSAVGPEVYDVRLGDTVFGMSEWSADGAQAQFCLARAEDIAIKPATLDHRIAASVPISALTAWQGLMEHCQLAPGESVLVHGAAGSVGHFAVQIARWRGAHVAGTVSSHNVEFAAALGAELVVDRGTHRFEDLVGSVDVVFDTVGGDILARSWSVLRPGGRLVTTASSSQISSEQRVKDAHFLVEPNREQLTRIARMIEAEALRPVVDSVFALADARRAYERKPVRGKVVLDLMA